MKKNIYFQLAAIGSIIFLLVFIYGLYFASNPREIPSAQIAKPAHDFKTITFKGEAITLSQFRGKPVVLNFWASWCRTCWKEARLFEAAHQKYTPQGAVFIGIAINDERDASLRFIRKYNKTYLLAPDDEIGTISLDYGVTAVPETFLIDENGIIKKKILGAIEDSVLDEFLIAALMLNQVQCIRIQAAFLTSSLFQSVACGRYP